MQTTSLLVELLVIGIFACSWGYPILSFFISTSELKKLVGSNSIGVLFCIGLVYFLGMLVNFIADIVLQWKDKSIAQKFGGKRNIQESRVLLFTQSGDGYEYSLQRRSIVRIFRANCLNTFFFLIVYLFNMGGVRKW